MKPQEGERSAAGTTPARRFFRVTYSNTSDEDPKLFQCRDGMAFNELGALLPPLGYEYGTTIHLYPDDERKRSDFPALRPTDLLVLTTRPPLSDGDPFPPRKHIVGSNNEFEAALFGSCFTYFEFCTRKHVILTKEAVALLRDEPSKWRHVEFFERTGGEVMQLFMGPVPVRPDARQPYTLAFFLRANHVPGLNCDLIVSFGMDGYGTLIWNRYIRTRHPEWLSGTRFIMARIFFKKPIPAKPLTPEFADKEDQIEVRLLTESGPPACR